MKRILLALLLLIPLSGCSVKEDRGDCPCQLYVHSDIDLPPGDVLVSVIQRGKVVNQGTMTREEIYEGGRCFSVPREMSVITFFSGISAMVPLSEGRLMQREGCECDELWSFSEYADVRGDEYHHHGTPHKNFARLSIAFAGSVGNAVIHVCGTTNGYDILDSKPLRGSAESPLSPSSREREYMVRVPRQVDDSMALRVETPGSDSRMIAIGEMIRQSGYNWEEEDLLDIRMTVDLSSSNVSLCVSDWDPVEFDIVETGSEEARLVLDPVPSPETLTKAFKTTSLSEPVGLFASVAGNGIPVGQVAPEYAYNERYTLSPAGYYRPDSHVFPVKFSPGTSAVFYAYSPYSGEGISFSSGETPGAPSLHFRTPSSGQYDLLCGCSRVYESSEFGPGESLDNVRVPLEHVLSCITVMTLEKGIDSLTVISVSLKGICGEGQLDMGSLTWTRSTELRSSYARKVNVELDGSPFQSILSASAGTAFMLLPQLVPQGAELELTVLSGSEEMSLSTSISGDSWPQGHDFIYVLALDDKSGNTTITPYSPGGDQNEQL